MRRSALGALSPQRIQNTNGRFSGLTCSAHSPHVAFDRPQPSFGGPAAATCRCTISSQFPQMLALPFCSVNIHSNIIGFSFRSTIPAKCTKHTADVRPYPTVRSFCTPVFPSGNDARRPPHRWAWIRGDGSDTKRGCQWSTVDRVAAERQEQRWPLPNTPQLVDVRCSRRCVKDSSKVQDPVSGHLSI